MFLQIWAKIALKDPKIVFFSFLENFVIIFPGNKLKLKIAIDISPPITYLAKFWFSSYEPKFCWAIELQDSLKCNISRKKWRMKSIFGMQRNSKIFYKLILSFWVCTAWHAQSTKNRKFPYLCNSYRKTWGMKLFSCLQINTKVFYIGASIIWGV